MTESNDNGWVRKTIDKGWTDKLMLGCSISPIGRWYDENYQAHPIHVNRHETEEHLVISAELPGCESQNIAVDIAHGCLIILVRVKNGTSLDERYHEMPLSKQINRRFADVEFSEGLLTVMFSKHRKIGLAALRSMFRLPSKHPQPSHKLSPAEK